MALVIFVEGDPSTPFNLVLNAQSIVTRPDALMTWYWIATTCTLKKDVLFLNPGLRFPLSQSVVAWSGYFRISAPSSW